MKASAPIFMPFAALVFVVGAMQLTAPRQADAVARNELAPVTALAPSEYFPSRFVSQAAEDSEHIQAF